MDGARPDTLSDAQLDRELEAALGVEPSPEFLARVRMRVAAEPQPFAVSGFSRVLQTPAFVESGFSRILRLAVEPMWAVGIVGIVLAIVVPQVMQDESARVRRVASSVADARPAAATDVPALQVPQPVKPRPFARPAPPAETEWGRTVPLRLSPVLFAEDDQKVFAMFMEAVGAGRLPEEAVHRPEAPGEMEGLTIEPLVIAPLPSLARTAREGEGQWE